MVLEGTSKPTNDETSPKAKAELFHYVIANILSSFLLNPSPRPPVVVILASASSPCAARF